MTRIHFYQISLAQHLSRQICELADQALRHGRRTLVRCSQSPVLTELETLLWQYPVDSFLPYDRATNSPHPVCLSADDDPGQHHGLLINLDAETPPWFARFEEVAEIIHGDDEHIQRKRERFSFYKHRGYPLGFSKV